MIVNIFLTIVFVIIGLVVSFAVVQLVSIILNKLKNAQKKADAEGKGDKEVVIDDKKPIVSQLMANPKGFVKSYNKKIQKNTAKSTKKTATSLAKSTKKTATSLWGQISNKIYGHQYNPDNANLNFPNAKPLALNLYNCLSRFEVYGNPGVIIAKEIQVLLNTLNVSKGEKDTIISIGVSMSAGETLKEKFNRIDRNNNGVITIDEMSNLFLPSKSEKIILNACKLSFYKNWKKLDYLVKQAMKVADLNKDSQIDFNEFRALYIIKLLEFYQLLNPDFNSSSVIKK